MGLRNGKYVIHCSEWEWYGHAGHLCVQDECLFHLTTKVGEYLVSTVGDWRPTDNGRRSFRPFEIGSGRLYETKVFRVEGHCSCGCGMPGHNGLEVGGAGYNSSVEAKNGHMKACFKVAAGDFRIA